MRRLAVVLLVLAALPAVAGPVPGADDGDPVLAHALRVLEAGNLPLRRSMLHNGMICLVKEDHSAPVAAVQIWIGTGSIHEDKHLGAGLSHAIEHMIFKGTDTRAPGDIEKEISDVGGTINAYTSFDRTVFHTALPSGSWKVGLEVLADAVRNAAFPAQEWEKERQVILREIDMGKDDPGRVLGKLMWRTAFTAHPYRFPVIGYREKFETITAADLVTFARRNYVPNNMIVIIVGDVDGKAVEAEVGRTFADFKRTSRPATALPREPEQTSSRFARETGAYKVSRLEWAYHGVPLQHPDAVVLDVLSVIVGEGRSSRLVRRIKEEQKLVHSINAWSYTPKEPGLFGFTASFDPANEKAVIDAIQKEVSAWLDSSFSREELAKAVRILMTRELRDLKTMTGQAEGYASGEFYASDPRFSETYLKGLGAVTPDRLMAVARKYLQPERRNLAILSPAAVEDGIMAVVPSSPGLEPRSLAALAPPVTENGLVAVIRSYFRPERRSLAALSPPVAGEETAIAGVPSPPRIEELTLSNGVRVLVREDHRLPFVSFCVAMGGGLLSENENNTGISRLLANLLVRGTTSRSAEAMAETVESLGGSLSPFSGHNSLGVQAECLSTDAETFLDIVADCLLNPVFPDDEIEKRKALQAAAIDRQHERPFFIAEEELRTLLFPSHPYRWHPTGTKATVAAVTRDQLATHLAALRTGSNMVVAVFGDLAVDQVRSLAGKHLAAVPAGPAPVLSRGKALPVFPGRHECRLPKKQTIVLVGFPGVAVTDPRHDSLTLLRRSMTGLTSELGRIIREDRGLAYYVGAFDQPGIDPGAFVVYAGIEEKHLSEVERLIAKEVSRIAGEGLPKDEFERARKQIIAAFEMSLQDTGGTAMTSALNELYGLGHEHLLTTRKRFEALTAADVQKAAASILNMKTSITSVVMPEKPEDGRQRTDDRGRTTEDR